MKILEKILRIITDPSVLVKHMWRKFPLGSIELREKFDAFHKPSYAYGMIRAAKLAKSLGITAISSIEFGVAEGGGLVCMEQIGKEIKKKFNIDVRVYGFDTGVGLTKPIDYRDMPYEYTKGDYPMNVQKLKGGLENATLVLGDVKDTVDNFFEKHNPPPIGFIAVDLDIYSPTKNAFRIFECRDEQILPRVICYFDDAAGENLVNEFTGELLAIREFNAEHLNEKITEIKGFSNTRYFRSSWNDRMYAYHRFNHRHYNQRVR